MSFRGNHFIMDRIESKAWTPGTVRWICFGCKFSSNSERKTKQHQEWIEGKPATKPSSK